MFANSEMSCRNIPEMAQEHYIDDSASRRANEWQGPERENFHTGEASLERRKIFAVIEGRLRNGPEYEDR